MAEIKRYAINASPDGHLVAVNSDAGRWIEFSDIATLEAEVAQLKRERDTQAVQMRDYDGIIDGLKQELAAANAKIERLCAPVTTDEAFPHSLDTTGAWAKTVDALTATRLKESSE